MEKILWRSKSKGVQAIMWSQVTKNSFLVSSGNLKTRGWPVFFLSSFSLVVTVLQGGLQQWPLPYVHSPMWFPLTVNWADMSTTYH